MALHQCTLIIADVRLTVDHILLLNRGKIRCKTQRDNCDTADKESFSTMPMGMVVCSVLSLGLLMFPFVAMSVAQAINTMM